MRDTTTKTVEALGLAIRSQRMRKGLSQVALAERMGVERKWVVRLEAGNHAAEIGNVLKAFQILDLEMKLFWTARPPLPNDTPTVTPRVGEVLAANRVGQAIKTAPRVGEVIERKNREGRSKGPTSTESDNDGTSDHNR